MIIHDNDNKWKQQGHGAYSARVGELLAVDVDGRRFRHIAARFTDSDPDEQGAADRRRSSDEVDRSPAKLLLGYDQQEREAVANVDAPVEETQRGATILQHKWWCNWDENNEDQPTNQLSVCWISNKMANTASVTFSDILN